MSDKDKIAVLVDALVILIALKDRKDTIGRDDYYKNTMPKAWDKARRALEQIQ